MFNRFNRPRVAWLLLPVLVLGGLLALLFIRLPSTTNLDRSVPSRPVSVSATTEYLALGDSVAYGVGASPPEQLGYPAVLFEQYLKPNQPGGLIYKNLAIPGETAVSFSSRPNGRSQLDNALAELESVRKSGGKVSLISLTIGGNDVLGARGKSETQKEVVLASFNQKLGQILDRLAGATDGQTDVVVTTYYDPFAYNDSPDELAWANRFNDTIRQQTSQHKMKIADFFSPVAGQEKQLTWIEQGDIHPNTAGHARLAQAVWQATGYTR